MTEDVGHGKVQNLADDERVASGSTADALSVVAQAQITLVSVTAPLVSDLPAGRHRLAWGPNARRPRLWMNLGGEVIDAFDPGTF